MEGGHEGDACCVVGIEIPTSRFDYDPSCIQPLAQPCSSLAPACAALCDEGDSLAMPTGSSGSSGKAPAPKGSQPPAKKVRPTQPTPPADPPSARPRGPSDPAVSQSGPSQRKYERESNPGAAAWVNAPPPGASEAEQRDARLGLQGRKKGPSSAASDQKPFSVFGGGSSASSSSAWGSGASCWWILRLGRVCIAARPWRRWRPVSQQAY